MHVNRRVCALVTIAIMTTPLASVVAPASADRTNQPGRHSHDLEESAQVILDWERILMQTVYPAKPVPTGIPLLGFTSMAMYDAVDRSIDAGDSSETAAVATAAHDVLVHYFPAQQTALEGYLSASLASVASGEEKARGRLLGAASASLMLADRAGDGYGDTSIHYTLAAGVGVWQPTPPATDMLGAWLGSLKPLALRRPIHLNGPDPLTSRAYADDYEEVRRLGGTEASGTERTTDQTDTAVFFNSNSATMIGDALIRRLESSNPLDIHDTARLFARMHAAMTDSVIQGWQLKRDVGFWRPNQAIAGADLDGNPDTAAQPDWAPLLTNPPYSDYVSGHSTATGSAAEVIRRTLGDNTSLKLITTAPLPDRTYQSLSDIERDAFYARIWGGLHFKDAMDDGYRLAHLTARQVMATID